MVKDLDVGLFDAARLSVLLALPPVGVLARGLPTSPILVRLDHLVWLDDLLVFNHNLSYVVDVTVHLLVELLLVASLY